MCTFQRALMAKKHIDIIRTLNEHDSLTAREIFVETHHHSYNGLRNSLTKLNKEGLIEVDKGQKSHAYSITGAGRDYLRLRVSPLLPFYLKTLPYLMDKPQTEAALFDTLEGYYSKTYYTECMATMREKGYVACDNGILSVAEKAIRELGLCVMRGQKP
ncbi:hypothetical protein V7O61_06550 [Methanolobus sp. WCC1]